MTLQEAFQQFKAADDAWDALLVDRFEDQAGQARYETRGRGEYGGEIDMGLKLAFDDRTNAYRVWDSLRILAQPSVPNQADKDLLAMALPFVEEAEKDPAYKAGKVAKVSEQIRAAIEGGAQ